MTMSSGNHRETELLRFLAEKYPRIKRLADHLISTVPYSLRLGSSFWRWYAFLAESEKWSRDQLNEYQLKRLRHLLSRLHDESEFYHSRLAGLNIARLNSLEEFQTNIALLTRDEFRANYECIKAAHSRPKDLVPCSTSGTTGNALQFYHSASDSAREWASICHQWRRVGFDPAKSRRAEFRGLTSGGCLVETFARLNMIRCSILHLRREHLPTYANAILKHQIEFYHGYPSALYLLAREILKSGFRFPQPKAILLASEAVHSFQLARIESAFPKAGIYAHYGCAERTVLAGWCEHRREYHVLPQYAFVEIDKGSHEVIGTNLYNTINGFVRYRMTDTVLQHTPEPCPACGRPYGRLFELGGRREEYLYSPEHGWIPPAILTYPFKALKAIHEIQLVQSEPRSIRIRYTASADSVALLPLEREQVEASLRQLVGREMILMWERVEEFARGPTGKFKWIVSSLLEQPAPTGRELGKD